MNFNIDAYLKNGAWRKGMYVLAGLFFTLLVFEAGMATGYRKAAFSYGMGQKYYRAFVAGPDGPFPHGEFTEVHGAAGKIISIALPTFVMEGPDKTEKIIFIGDDTEIRRFRDTLQPTDLAKDDMVVVIGEPDDQSQIQARLIRVLPPVE